MGCPFESLDDETLIAQTSIHITFLLSAMAIAACDRIMNGTIKAAKTPH
jgi:uncharacterized membrane protein YqhA